MLYQFDLYVLYEFSTVQKIFQKYWTPNKELNHELSDASEHRAVLIESSGKKVFCAGHDLTELQTGTGLHSQIFELCANVMKQIRHLDVPVIAAVDGIAAAAGCQARDLLIALRNLRSFTLST